MRAFRKKANDGDVSASMVLNSARYDCDKFPALNCQDCKLIILDYNEDHVYE